MPIFLKSNLKHKKTFCLYMLLCFSVSKTLAISDKIDVLKNKFIYSASTQYGFIIVHRASVQHFSQTHFSVFQANISKQTSGSLLWHHLYHRPRVGINFLYTNFAGNTLLHSASGAQAFIDFCKHPEMKNNFHFKMGCGIGYIQKPFNRDSNYKNIAIGTHFNGLVQFGFYYNFRLNKYLQSSIGGSLIHFSNGAIKVPNLGINIASVGVALHFLQSTSFTEKSNLFNDSIKQKNYIEFTLGSGIKQNYPPSSTSFGVVALRSQYYFLNKQKHNVSAGVDVFYDNGLYRKMNEDNNARNNNQTALQLGLNVQYQQNISRISIPVFMGVYVYSNYKGNGFLYHGLGIKYKINNRFCAGVILKTHYAKADYFLWNLVYKL
jgi:hypothetical protein